MVFCLRLIAQLSVAMLLVAGVAFAARADSRFQDNRGGPVGLER